MEKEACGEEREPPLEPPQHRSHYPIKVSGSTATDVEVCHHNSWSDVFVTCEIQWWTIYRLPEDDATHLTKYRVRRQAETIKTHTAAHYLLALSLFLGLGDDQSVSDDCFFYSQPSSTVRPMQHTNTRWYELIIKNDSLNQKSWPDSTLGAKRCVSLILCLYT